MIPLPSNTRLGTLLRLLVVLLLALCLVSAGVASALGSDGSTPVSRAGVVAVEPADTDDTDRSAPAHQTTRKTTAASARPHDADAARSDDPCTRRSTPVGAMSHVHSPVGGLPTPYLDRDQLWAAYLVIHPDCHRRDSGTQQTTNRPRDLSGRGPTGLP